MRKFCVLLPPGALLSPCWVRDFGGFVSDSQVLGAWETRQSKTLRLHIAVSHGVGLWTLDVFRAEILEQLDREAKQRNETSTVTVNQSRLAAGFSLMSWRRRPSRR